jgi:hypothetical protein
VIRTWTIIGVLEEEPHLNPHARTWEFSLRDPDGCYVTMSALSSDAGEAE